MDVGIKVATIFIRLLTIKASPINKLCTLNQPRPNTFALTRLMKKTILLVFLLGRGVYAQVTVTVDLSVEPHSVSPYLYGRNNSLSDDPARPLSAADWTRLRDSGVTILREGGGNNSTKYNWRRKLTSHPDWYNNVYPHDWDFAAKSLQQNLPGVSGLWSFQLLGKAAKTTTGNFNDWGYNNSQWWAGVNQNLAGGGVVNTNGGAKATTEGNPNLYLEDWPADSTVRILDHWFNTLGLQKDPLTYWNMDNEVEIWSGTHDDVMPVQETADNFMQRYFAVAKKARQLFPGIKLAGPVPANEWQWYNWQGGIVQGGKKYAWLEYFIKRVAEEQQASGLRLLDVLDIHFYPGSTNPDELVQYHRVFFDKNYVFPEANGVKNITGSWDNSQTREYVFARCSEWLTQYMGANHGVRFGMTETGIPWVNANTSAVWYAGMLGEFMRHPEMELFTPWSWQVGMWEVLHLYARYNKALYVAGTSSDEPAVSAYPTINTAGDSLTLVLVNRSKTTRATTVTLQGYAPVSEPFQVLRLSNLSNTETFTSHASNALQKSTVTASGNVLNLSLPAMSVTSVLVSGERGNVVTSVGDETTPVLRVHPNPTGPGRFATLEINGRGRAIVDLIDLAGRTVGNLFSGDLPGQRWRRELSLSEFTPGLYVVRLRLGDRWHYQKVLLTP